MGRPRDGRVGRGDLTAPLFVVGSPRSGTTLLRLMLDSHPRLAIPPESHFVPRLERVFRRHGPDEVLRRIFADRFFARWELGAEAVRAHVARVRPRSYPELIAAVFGCYAAAQGKARWGDKTPPHALELPWLADRFPDARFVHIIRDGREVAASLAQQSFGPGSAVLGAGIWAQYVGRARGDGARLGPARYSEVRLDRLVADPEREMRRICHHIGEEFAPEMLDYHRTDHVLGVNPSRTDYALLSRPLVAGPTRDWRAGLSRVEQQGVEARCQRQLIACGFAVSPVPLRAHAYAWTRLAGRRLADLAHRRSSRRP